MTRVSHRVRLHIRGRKSSSNGNASFLFRLPPPATDHDRSGSSRLTPMDDEAIYLIRTCRLRRPLSPVPLGFFGLVSRPDSAVLGGIPLTPTDYQDFRPRGPRVTNDDSAIRTGWFVAHVCAVVDTTEARFGRATV